MDLTAKNNLVTSSQADRAAAVLRFVFFSVLAAGVVFYVVRSLHWPLLVDSPIMHYVNFLMDHGFTPYRDITDNNMPGAYLTERWAMQVFGTTDLAWRVYDFFLLAALTIGAVVIAKPYGTAAGFYAGGMFTLLHASEGPNYAVEREQVMTMLLVAGIAFLFTALRRERAWVCLLYGAATGMACSIKPTVLLFPLAVLPMTGWLLRRNRRPMLRYLLWSFAGLLLALAVNLAFLVRYGAVADFWFVLSKITPAYVSLHRPGFHGLMYMLVPRNLLLLIPFGLLLVLLRRRWSWERMVLLVGAVVGAISFFLQQKGFLHHRYLFVTFLLLLLGLEFFPALRERGWPRLLGAAGVLLTLLLSVPHYLHSLRDVSDHSELTASLESDLARLGVAPLERNIMCFDLVYGCLNSLYHLGIVENNGFTGDLLLFSPSSGPAVDYYREKFLASEARHPSAVYVVTNQWFGDVNTFGKLDTWPAFADDLRRNYTLAVERSFPHEGLPPEVGPGGGEPDGYRIYVRNGSTLPRL